MAKIYKQITDLIGKTPLVELGKYSASKGLETPVIAKVEFFNPGGSVKDRIALAMIEDAEQKGILKPGATIIEPTSGNTGVGLALVSAVKGYHLILTMPETMSVERRNLVKAYGAEVRLTSGKDGMPYAIKAAEELRDSIPGSVILGQFTNPANPAKHYATTGPEIWADTDGEIDIFVAGVGTGNHFGYRQVLEGAESKREGDCRRTSHIACIERRTERSSQDSGHRCRLRSRDLLFRIYR